MGIFSLLNKNKTEISGIKTFLEIPGFSFQYPEFKDWKVSLVKKISNDEYSIFLDCPFETAIAPWVKIIKAENTYKGPNDSTIEDNPNIKTNKNGVKYYINLQTKSEGSPFIIFYAGNFVTTVYPYIHEGDGYSGKILIDKIIETFKFSCSPEEIGAVALSDLMGQDFSSQDNKIYSEATALEAVTEELKQKNENPNDFYTIIEVFEKSGLNGYLITYHLLHKDDFKPENCNKSGNPSGKSRDMVYDTNQDKIIIDLLWK